MELKQLQKKMQYPCYWKRNLLPLGYQLKEMIVMVIVQMGRIIHSVLVHLVVWFLTRPGIHICLYLPGRNMIVLSPYVIHLKKKWNRNDQSLWGRKKAKEGKMVLLVSLVAILTISVDFMIRMMRLQVRLPPLHRRQIMMSRMMRAHPLLHRHRHHHHHPVRAQMMNRVLLKVTTKITVVVMWKAPVVKKAILNYIIRFHQRHIHQIIFLHKPWYLWHHYSLLLLLPWRLSNQWWTTQVVKKMTHLTARMKVQSLTMLAPVQSNLKMI
mmetsp:Transcript_5918/g.6593  ORF Transcript_5918/g.6593 Transcript_5918/m.6593 type:complete len:268 (+) Transcript_5918:753-1556(+)